MTANVYQQAELLPLAAEVQKLPMLAAVKPLHQKPATNSTVALESVAPITETLEPARVTHTSAPGTVPDTDKPCGWVSVPLGFLNICTF
jgi:hypothetical protein